MQQKKSEVYAFVIMFNDYFSSLLSVLKCMQNIYMVSVGICLNCSKYIFAMRFYLILNGVFNNELSRMKIYLSAEWRRYSIGVCESIFNCILQKICHIFNSINESLSRFLHAISQLYIHIIYIENSLKMYFNCAETLQYDDSDKKCMRKMFLLNHCNSVHFQTPLDLLLSHTDPSFIMIVICFCMHKHIRQICGWIFPHCFFLDFFFVSRIWNDI